MKTNFMKLCALGLGALTFFGCQEEEDLMLSSTNSKMAVDANYDAIDFTRYETGFITEVHSIKGVGPVKLMNKARNSEGTVIDENRAMIFDMANPTGDDTNDLFHPDYGKGLVINHLGTSVPNDNQWGGTMELDFSAVGPVTINATTVLDIDEYEDESFIQLYDANGKLLTTYELKPLGDASKQTAVLNTSNVMKMVVVLDGSNGFVGSGAIDDIEFYVMPKQEEPQPVIGCTRTQGYWKTHGDPANTKKYDSTWKPYVDATFYKSGMTYMAVLNEPVKGRAYFILAHQYIAALLNVKAGASMPAEVKTAFDAATEYFEDNAPSKKKDPMHDQLTAWATILDDYNNGKIGPGHCD